MRIACIVDAFDDFDTVLTYKDARFDMEHVHSNCLLDLSQVQQAHVRNDSSAVSDCNEKMTITRFTLHRTDTCQVARRADS